MKSDILSHVAMLTSFQLTLAVMVITISVAVLWYLQWQYQLPAQVVKKVTKSNFDSFEENIVLLRHVAIVLQAGLVVAICFSVLQLIFSFSTLALVALLFVCSVLTGLIALRQIIEAQFCYPFPSALNFKPMQYFKREESK